jgi:hypothetical protein
VANGTIVGADTFKHPEDELVKPLKEPHARYAEDNILFINSCI